jgi:hypothetical protein
MKKKIRRKLTRMWSDPNMPAPAIWAEAARHGVSKEECDGLYAEAREKFKENLKRQINPENPELWNGGQPNEKQK